MADTNPAAPKQEAPVKAPAPPNPAWLKTELARNPQRPHPMDFIQSMFTDLSEIHGDRGFADDAAMYCAMARLDAEEVLVICNQKGRTTRERAARNFGMPNPEGYRKALRCMKLAEKFGRPVLTFIDLAGANPGLGAEERGQGEAIARNLKEMSTLRVPTIATVTGEGGSGGALALAVADRVFMMENAIYSVISPEGCASIMWRDPAKRDKAAAALKITAKDIYALGCCDAIVAEPGGGAHVDGGASFASLGETVREALRHLQAMPVEAMLAARYDKFRTAAQFYQQ